MEENLDLIDAILPPLVPDWAQVLSALAVLALAWLLCLCTGVFRRVRRPLPRTLCVLAAAAILHAGAITARSKDEPEPPEPPEPPAARRVLYRLIDLYPHLMPLAGRYLIRQEIPATPEPEPAP